ncbi:MAG TPA: metallophosphoesterase [Blastocatellia bacterium]|nr:metallophosphoesterase [Blastocatellia bacterium]
MHKITGERDEVLKLMKNTISQLGNDSAKVKKAGMKSLSLTSDAKWPDQRDSLVDILKRGYDNEQKATRAAGIDSVTPNERAVDSWYAPRNRAVAVFQAAMDEYLESHPDAKVTPKPAKKKGSTRASSVGAASKTAGPAMTLDAFYETKPGKKKGKAGTRTGAAAIAEQFDNLDPRWVEVVWAKAKILFKGKHKFISHSSATDFRFGLADEATIAIVGDWGGGNEAAQAVAKQINKLNPDHIIHLGDVYYAGTEKEVKDRFLKYWPKPAAPGLSFALNSNHEMYSGGYGYFDVTLKEFKQPASYFSLGNKNWRFIGLDTGYVDHDLNPEQVKWLTAQFKGNNPRTILLSHHQLFSAYEKTDTDNLTSRVQPFLNANQIYGWIWGHEHLCVVFKPNLGIKAVCLGNGCFPYNVPSKQPSIPIEWIDDRAQPDDPDYKGIHTFALLHVTPEKIDIEYIDQDGNVADHKDSWA